MAYLSSNKSSSHYNLRIPVQVKNKASGNKRDAINKALIKLVISFLPQEENMLIIEF